MASIDYRSTASRKVTYLWFCSKCHTENQETSEITYTGKSFSIGRKYNKVSADEATTSAQTGIDVYTHYLLKRQDNFKCYLRLGLYSRCKKCGNKEAWSTLMSPGINRFFYLPVLWIYCWIAMFGIISICGIVIELFKNGFDFSKSEIPSYMLWIVGLTIILPLLYYALKGIDKQICKRKDKQLAQLPDSAFPIAIHFPKPQNGFQ